MPAQSARAPGAGRPLAPAGHDVTAVARNPARLPHDVSAGRPARIVAADLISPDPHLLESAIAGADAVCAGASVHEPVHAFHGDRWMPAKKVTAARPISACPRPMA
jgi:putative NADH-flavin reductase